MTVQPVPISAFTFTNRSDDEIALILEPEGDVVLVPVGKSCQITTDRPTDGELECEVEFGTGAEVTVYLSVVKQVFIGGERVR